MSLSPGGAESSWTRRSTKSGGAASGIQSDIASLDDLDRLFAIVREKRGGLDILFANAGSGDVAPLGVITEEQFDRTFGINVGGALFTVQKALLLMKAGGSIFLTGSTIGSKGTPTFSVHSANKAAIRNFARGWALALKNSGIRVNVPLPGATSTSGLHGLASMPEEEKALVAGLIAQTPLGRFG